jgi:hypothetical protein
VLCCCQQGNEFQGFTKEGKLVFQMGNYHLLKQCCTLILGRRLFNYAGSNMNLYGWVKLDNDHSYLKGRNLKGT